MTKERRLAIEMWEYIYKHPHLIHEFFKEDFCAWHDLKWKFECWFCQYVRKDYRDNLTSREDIDPAENACGKCPLYKWYASRHQVSFDFCGCDYDNYTIYQRVLKGDKEAILLVIKALKGEPIWREKDE